MRHPKHPTPSERYPALDSHFKRLETLASDNYECAKRLLSLPNTNIYATDQYVLAALKRSMDIIDAAQVMLERWNFTVASALLRMQLDSLLKLVYLSRLPNADAMVREVLGGKLFNKIKDSQGQPLTDKRLCEHAQRVFPWVQEVYKKTSSMVHLSASQYYVMIDGVDVERRFITHRIAVGSPSWPEESLREYFETFERVTESLFSVVESWISAKGTLPP